MDNQKVLMDRRNFVAGSLAGGAALATPGILRAQARVLRMSAWLPPGGLISQNIFSLWAADVATLTEGRVTVELVNPPLGPPPRHLDLLQSGEADIVYSLHGYTGDRFPRAKIGQFSFLGDAYSASHAFSKVYGRLLDAEEEHEAMKLLGLFQHGPGVLMLRDKTVRGPEDYAGLKIRTSGGFIGGLIEDLGAENVPMSPFDVRDGLIDGTIDGVAFPFEAAQAFNILDEVTFVSELPGGYYNATWFLGMSEQAAGSIDPGDLAAIERRSAETVHVLAAKAFDYADFVALEAFKERGVPVERASDELTGHIRGLVQAYETEWISEISGAGYDGRRALDFTRRITGN